MLSNTSIAASYYVPIDPNAGILIIPEAIFKLEPSNLAQLEHLTH